MDENVGAVKLEDMILITEMRFGQKAQDVFSRYRQGESFEKCSISIKIKTHEDFNHSNILNISRIKIRMQRRDCADKRRLRKGAFFKALKVFLEERLIIFYKK